jgi:hypothetical protein
MSQLRPLEGKPTERLLSLRSVWVEAKDVQIVIKPVDGTLAVAGGPLRLP